MDYFLKASAIIVLFYTCYKLFLQHETYFQSNRWFLLIGLFFATILPLVVIPIYIEYTPVPITFSETTTFTPQHTTTTTSIDLWLILITAYLVGTLVFFGKVILQFLSLSKLFKKHKKTKQDQFIFIETEDNIAPFSFFNHIVFNANLFTAKELDHIITHEKIHAKQFHSIDVILIQIATILFWFNPFIWWYKKALHQNLEFIADYEAQNKMECSKSYQTVLLKASLSQNQLALPTNFYQSLIKKRIIMLQKSKSKNSSYLKLAIVLPFLALFLMSFNTEEIYVAKAEAGLVDEVKTEVFTITSKSTDSQIEAIKNRLEVQTDGLKIRFTDIERNSDGEIIKIAIETKSKDNNKFNKHVTYKHKASMPIADIALKIENGELIFGYEEFDMNMKVTKDGLITMPSKATSTKTVSKIGTIHMQNNGDTIKMKIDSDDKEDNHFTYKIRTEDSGGKKSKLTITETNKKPLLVVNGKIYNNMTIDNMDTDNVESINVLKGKSAKDKYGNKGENGVVEIKTKSNTNFWVTKSKKQNKEHDSVYFITKTIKVTDSLNPKKVMFRHPNGDTNASQTIYANSFYSNDSTIIIIDGVKVKNSELSKINPNNIKSMNVLKGKAAKEVYGSVFNIGSENGVIELKTKSGNPNTFTYRVNANFEDDNVSKSSVMFALPKTATDQSIKKNTKFMKSEYGLDVKVNKLKRNKAGEIVKIKVSIEDENGQKASATFQSTEGIPTIKYGSDMNGNVFINSEK